MAACQTAVRRRETERKPIAECTMNNFKAQFKIKFSKTKKSSASPTGVERDQHYTSVISITYPSIYMGHARTSEDS